MSSIILFNTVLVNSLIFLVAGRPNYRFDYQYERAFDTFYKLHRTPSTWAEARMRCIAEGSELLVLDSLDEADSVVLLVTLVLNKFEGIFVGVHDLYAERSFVTVRGTSLTESILNLLWEYREPTHRRGRCVAMRRTGRLFVQPCQSALPFVCKIKGKDVRFRSDCNTFDTAWKLGPNNTCYFMQEEPQPWSQAYARCLSAGGHLAILNSKEEAEHLKTLFREQHLHVSHPKRMPDDGLAFLGYSDVFKRFHYVTIHGQRVEDLGYKEWEVNCSIKANLHASNVSLRCGGVRRNGLLAVGDCTLPHMFFCEKPVNSTVVRNTLRHGTAHALKPLHNHSHELHYW